MDSITGPQSLVTNYTYFANSATGTKAQRLESITHTRSGVQYSKNVYDYDPAGRITSWTKEQTTTAAENSINSFGYNPSDEVTAYRKALASAPTTVVDQQDWAYDNVGNWLSTGTPAAMSTRTHNSLNQLTQIGGAGSTVVAGKLNEFAEVTVNSQPATLRSDPVNGGYQFSKKVNVAEGSNTLTVQATDKDTPPNTTTKNYSLTVGGLSRSFTYDANGNLLSDGDRTFTWDAKNRLLSVTVGGTRYRWQYDYRDRRVKEFKKVGTAAETTEKIFFWHENDLIMERNGANTATLRTYHHGGFQEGNPTLTTSAKYLSTTDHLGNVREVIAANTNAGTVGDVKARYDYTVFQGPVKVSGTVDASLLTIGRYYHHAATGLELALYRAYDPVLGRWISEDPIGERGGLNLYRYNKNSTTKFIDSDGRLPSWKRPEKYPGQQYEEIFDRQRKNRSRGDNCSIQSTEKSRQRDKRELKEEAERALEELQQDEETSDGESEVDSEDAANALGAAGCATMLYWIISELSRLFPPRNLIPVP